MQTPIAQPHAYYAPPAAQPNQMTAAQRLIPLGISAVFFLVACTLPVFTLRNGEVWPGFQVLMMGAGGLFLGQFAWFANVLAFGTVMSLAFGWRPGIIGFSVAAFLVGLHIFAFPGNTMRDGVSEKMQVASLGAAIWPWFVSLITPALAMLVTGKPRGEHAGAQPGV